MDRCLLQPGEPGNASQCLHHPGRGPSPGLPSLASLKASSTSPSEQPVSFRRCAFRLLEPLSAPHCSDLSVLPMGLCSRPRPSLPGPSPTSLTPQPRCQLTPDRCTLTSSCCLPTSGPVACPSPLLLGRLLLILWFPRLRDTSSETHFLTTPCNEVLP